VVGKDDKDNGIHLFGGEYCEWILNTVFIKNPGAIIEQDIRGLDSGQDLFEQ
jgi:hypothetical protein